MPRPQVLTGTLAIYAIQRAGLGVAQTTYSSLSVFTSFLWGVAAFGEAGSSVGLSLLGLAMVAGGLAGLGHAASRPRPALQRVPSAESTNFFLGSAGSGEGAATAGGAAGLGRHGPAHQDEMGGTSPSGLEPIREGDWDEPDPQPAGDPALGKGAGGGSSSDLQVCVGPGAWALGVLASRLAACAELQLQILYQLVSCAVIPHAPQQPHINITLTRPALAAGPHRWHAAPPQHQRRGPGGGRS